MQSVSTFFKTLFLSFTSLRYYADVVRAPISFSLKYYSGTTILLAFIYTAIITVRWIIPFDEFVRGVPSQLITAFPAELEISINNGQASTNVEEPYYIPVTALQPIADRFNDTVLGASESSIENILVIDTQATPNNIVSYKTYALLTWDSFSYITDEGTIETVSLTDVDNLIINRTTVTALIHEIEPLLNYLIPLSILTLVCVFIFYGVVRLAYLLVIGIITWIVTKFMHIPLSYTQSFQTLLHTNFLPYSILTGLAIGGIIPTMPFLETSIQILVVLLVLQGIKAEQRGQKTME